MRAIQLDATYEPLGIISWKKAFMKTLELKDKYGNYIFESAAKILWTYPDQVLHSATHEFDWPAIIILKEPSNRLKKMKRVKPSLKSILVRDLYTCQYCGKKLGKKTGTRDHVYPESLGGKATWENLVAACRTCQSIKADKLCEDVNMFPIKTPREPTLVERFHNGIRIANSYERKTWIKGLKKLGLQHLIRG